MAKDDKTKPVEQVKPEETKPEETKPTEPEKDVELEAAKKAAAEQPRAFGATNRLTTVEEIAAKGDEKLVKMIFPKRVTLTLANHLRLDFNPGVQDVPESLTGHWYLKANGVVRA